MINENRLLNEFIELVSVPCPSKDEKAEAELIMAKLRELGLEPVMDKANEKTGGTCGNVWAYGLRSTNYRYQGGAQGRRAL